MTARGDAIINVAAHLLPYATQLTVVAKRAALELPEVADFIIMKEQPGDLPVTPQQHARFLVLSLAEVAKEVTE